MKVMFAFGGRLRGFMPKKVVMVLCYVIVG